MLGIPKNNLIGNKYGKLLVLEYLGRNKNHRNIWLCKCDCGNEVKADTSILENMDKKSCGCSKYEKQGSIKYDLKDKTFGEWKVLNFSHSNNGRTYWYCQCSCSNNKIVLTQSLINGSSKSCGHRITEEEENILNRNIDGYYNWSYLIKEKYNFKCYVCGDNKGGNLVSHHLFNYARYPELRTDLNNGVCLCKNCHKQFHKLFGNRNNTMNQFEEYLGIINDGN